MCIFLTMKNTIKVKWPVQTTIPIQWGEMDAFNHVNNVVYIRWCETARIELFRKIWGDRGINMKEILEGNGIGPILANFNVNYKIPIVPIINFKHSFSSSTILITSKFLCKFRIR